MRTPMKATNRCLYCYGPLAEEEHDFHKRCSKKMFGTDIPPDIGIGLPQVQELAAQVVIKSVAVTGVQPKLSLDIEPVTGDPKRSRFTIVGLWGRYIFKPPTAEFPSLPENEDVTMHLAQLLKIPVAEHCLIRLQTGELAYLTRRFDRLADGRKLPLEDMCQLAERLTADKYHGSMEQVGKLILKHSTQPLLDAVTLFEVTLLSFLTGNADMHLKNFSLLRPEPGRIVLSPAYDLLSTALVIPDDREELALTLNGRKNKLRTSDFAQLAGRLSIPPKAVEKTFKKFRDLLPVMLQTIDDSFLPGDLKARYKELLQSRADRVLAE